MARTNYSSGSPWEATIGYSRAVKIHNMIEVSGTVASGENGEVVGKGDAYLQTMHVYAKIKQVLEQAGASMSDVTRVRMYVTDISQWQDFGRAHSEYFKDIRPCNTMIEVKGLVDPQYLVEIEVSAVLA